MSIGNACARYGVTEKQCQEAQLPCQWRSAYGNSYAVVKVSDILDLKRKLAHAKEKEEKEKLIAEHGQEGYEEMKKKQEQEKQAAEQARKEKQQAERTNKRLWKKSWRYSPLPRMQLVSNDIDQIQLGKTDAKSEFFIDESDLKRLEGEKVGRSVKYSAFDVIQASENSSKHRGWGNKPKLIEKIRTKPSPRRTLLYTAYLKKKVDLEMDKVSKEVVDGAMKQVQDLLQKEVDESEAKMKAAQEEFDTKQTKIRSFETVFGDDENVESAPKKKKARKTTA